MNANEVRRQGARVGAADMNECVCVCVCMCVCV